MPFSVGMIKLLPFYAEGDMPLPSTALRGNRSRSGSTSTLYGE